MSKRATVRERFERRGRIMAARARGKAWSEIAADEGIATSTAHEAFHGREFTPEQRARRVAATQRWRARQRAQANEREVTCWCGAAYVAHLVGGDYRPISCGACGR